MLGNYCVKFCRYFFCYRRVCKIVDSTEYFIAPLYRALPSCAEVLTIYSASERTIRVLMDTGAMFQNFPSE
jgi:hypothetical protein